MDGYTPYLFGDEGYPCLKWIMTPYKETGTARHSLLELLYNKWHKRGRSVVVYAFGVMKKTFCEMLGTSELHISILPDVF